jgi:hypothetical protein
MTQEQITQVVSAPCGCHWKNAGLHVEEREFAFCPLHAAAPALLAAVEGVHDDLRTGWIFNESRTAQRDRNKHEKRLLKLIEGARGWPGT